MKKKHSDFIKLLISRCINAFAVSYSIGMSNVRGYKSRISCEAMLLLYKRGNMEETSRKLKDKNTCFVYICKI